MELIPYFTDKCHLCYNQPRVVILDIKKKIHIS